MYGKFEYSEEFKDLVLNMMSYNHKNRPTLEQIRNHPWMSMGEEKIETPKKREKADGLKREVIRDMNKIKQNLIVKQIYQPTSNTSKKDDDFSQSAEVQISKTSFPDLVRYQYKTNTSTSNFFCK